MSRPVNVAPSTINQKPSLSLPRTSKEALVSQCRVFVDFCGDKLLIRFARAGRVYSTNLAHLKMTLFAAATT